ncbi:hypothetical protein DACRYDRAFT_105110 [Dacryopinax primogenitus]|uniref:Peptidase C14 caspase domain-containing protein n=1 Tax=Dacryopinax primogenitus (strain DJM 731) TaxID=1858805 RepID=M5G762_DACPD|nr:uncharacterized protein DACRYDRAFT_105110 [Dacryopinax primogenitus]EJU04045.1 hypothetical protein DACRYDRAFT_105110 [Dacryopinax primogenitus]
MSVSSQISSNKRRPPTFAVLIGCRYLDKSDHDVQLEFTHEDVVRRKNHLLSIGCPLETMLILVDVDMDGCIQPTRDKILLAMDWVVSCAQQNAEEGCTIFWYYAGHGAQTVDPTGVEENNQAIVPVDVPFVVEPGRSGRGRTLSVPDKIDDDYLIIDDDLNKRMLQPLPATCHFRALFDVSRLLSVASRFTIRAYTEGNLNRMASLHVLASWTSYVPRRRQAGETASGPKDSLHERKNSTRENEDQIQGLPVAAGDNPSACMIVSASDKIGREFFFWGAGLNDTFFFGIRAERRHSALSEDGMSAIV